MEIVHSLLGIAFGYRVQSQLAFPLCTPTADALDSTRPFPSAGALAIRSQTEMFQIASRGRFGRSLLLIGVALSASLMASAAFAGGCPADQVKPDATKPVEVGHDGVTDTVIAMIDVDKEQGIKDRKFRMRKLVVEPGGTVPWHSHSERPAIIYVVEGVIDEYASNCAVPIVHKAGDVIAETKEILHWWKNTGNETVVLLSADLLKDPADHNM
jgi:quercetin dioxygenase-like cupin family protein